MSTAETITLILSGGVILGSCVWNVATTRANTLAVREAVRELKGDVKQNARDIKTCERRISRIAGIIRKYIPRRA